MEKMRIALIGFGTTEVKRKLCAGRQSRPAHNLFFSLRSCARFDLRESKVSRKGDPHVCCLCQYERRDKQRCDVRPLR